MPHTKVTNPKHKSANTVLTDEQKHRLTVFAIDEDGNALKGAKLETFYTLAFQARDMLVKNRTGVWMIGRRLKKIKKAIGRPTFLKYLREYVKITEMTAGRHINVYEAWPKLADFKKQVQQASVNGDTTFRKMYVEAAKINRKNNGKPDPAPRPKRTDYVQLVQRLNKRLAKPELPQGQETREQLIRELRAAQKNIQRCLDKLTKPRVVNGRAPAKAA